MTNRTSNLSSFSIAGQAAAGEGAMAGWRGQSKLSHQSILAGLENAGLPSNWAPKVKSPIAQAGHAVRLLNNKSYVVRRDKTADLSPVKGLARTCNARWSIGKAVQGKNVGDAMGPLVCTVEVSGTTLTYKGDDTLGNQILATFNGLMDNQVHQAGDVTTWISDLLWNHCGATGLGLGYYIPQTGKTLAQKITDMVASLGWGTNWINPLLPIATSDQLKLGIARSLADDVKSIGATLNTYIEKNEMDAGKAGLLLNKTTTIQDRLTSYRLFCGEEAMDSTIRILNSLIETLNTYIDDTSKRFALLDIKSIREITADNARTLDIDENTSLKLSAKSSTPVKDLLARMDSCASLGALRPLGESLRSYPEGPSKEALRKAYRAAQERIVKLPTATATPIVRTPTKPPQPAEPQEPSDADTRFSLIEMD